MSAGEKVFDRLGRSFQLRIRTAQDVRSVLTLDHAHWAATSISVGALQLDPVFLALLDTDSNGRIMCFEVEEAIKWLFGVLTDTSGIDSASPVLDLEVLNTEHPDGQQIKKTAQKILSQAGDSSTTISLDKVRQVKKAVEERSVSEAGVVLPESIDDEARRTFADDVVAALAGVPHPSGKQGLNEEQLDRFIDQAKAYTEWYARGDTAAGTAREEIMVLGGETKAAYALLESLQSKMDEFFAQCRAVRFDPRLAEMMPPREDDLAALDKSDPTAMAEMMAAAPLATPDPNGECALGETVNIAYREKLEALFSKVVGPLLGKDVSVIDVDVWKGLVARFDAYASWLAEEPETAVGNINVDILRSYLDPGYAEDVRKHIAERKRTEHRMANIRMLEKVLLYQSLMRVFVNNFVSFPDLYDPAQRAAFEMGTLVMDGRHFTFSVRVDDRKRHASIAKAGNMFIMYIEVMPAGDAKAYEIAVPVTSGGKGNLCVGKRGVFKDIRDVESDARVVEIVENPISLREAVIAPFVRLGKLLSNRIESITSSAEKNLDTQAKAAMDTAPTTAATPSSGLLNGGILMGGGVAVAALGSAMAYITKTLSGIGLVNTLIGVLIAVLAVIVPATVIAFFRLRARDLSVILEGCEWAVNIRMRLTFRQAYVFTNRPPLPMKKRYGRLIAVCLLIVTAAFVTAGLGLRGCSARRAENCGSCSATTNGVVEVVP